MINNYFVLPNFFWPKSFPFSELFFALSFFLPIFFSHNNFFRQKHCFYKLLVVTTEKKTVSCKLFSNDFLGMLFQRIQANTGYLMLLQVTSSYYRLLYVSTSYYRLWKVITGYYRLIQVTTVFSDYYKLLRVTTSRSIKQTNDYR